MMSTHDAATLAAKLVEAERKITDLLSERNHDKTRILQLECKVKDGQQTIAILESERVSWRERAGSVADELNERNDEIKEYIDTAISAGRDDYKNAQRSGRLIITGGQRALQALRKACFGSRLPDVCPSCNREIPDPSDDI